MSFNVVALIYISMCYLFTQNDKIKGLRIVEYQNVSDISLNSKDDKTCQNYKFVNWYNTAFSLDTIRFNVTRSILFSQSAIIFGEMNQ